MGIDPHDVTVLLERVRAGEGDGRERLGEMIYTELRQLAAAKMLGERPDHTLTPTALANEAWLKLCDAKCAYKDRSHFLAVAATAMRRILIDYARARNASKRGGVAFIRVEDIDIPAPATDLELLVLDEALTRLAQIDPRSARVVELKYFAGLTSDEIASVLGVTRRTVERNWAFARVWLFDQVSAASTDDRILD